MTSHIDGQAFIGRASFPLPKSLHCNGFQQGPTMVRFIGGTLCLGRRGRHTNIYVVTTGNFKLFCLGVYFNLSAKNIFVYSFCSCLGLSLPPRLIWQLLCWVEGPW